MKKLSNNSFSKQKGFTLIELVVVIVILGILAATAVPKFVDITSDARESVMRGLQGNINSAVNLVHAKALIQGGNLDTVSIGNVDYILAFGYPVVGDGTGNGIDKLVALDNDSEIVFDVFQAVADDPDGAGGTVDGTGERFGFVHSTAPNPAECSLFYTDAANAETAPVITSNFNGC
jgi:MSHA pilin protein MshA